MRLTEAAPGPRVPVSADYRVGRAGGDECKPRQLAWSNQADPSGATTKISCKKNSSLIINNIVMHRTVSELKVFTPDVSLVAPPDVTPI